MKRSILFLNNLGVKDVYIHCEKPNLASSHTIKACSGVLELETSYNEEIIERYAVQNT